MLSFFFGQISKNFGQFANLSGKSRVKSEGGGGILLIFHTYFLAKNVVLPKVD